MTCLERVQIRTHLNRHKLVRDTMSGEQAETRDTHIRCFTQSSSTEVKFQVISYRQEFNWKGLEPSTYERKKAQHAQDLGDLTL